MFKVIKSSLKNEIYKYLKSTLNNAIPGGKWHVLNHSNMVVVKKNCYRYNQRINDFHLRGIIAFLITMYEFDFFSKIMIAVGLPYAEKRQAECYDFVTKTYILRWIPGMLTSRYIMARDFIRSTRAKSSLVRYNLRYMRTTVLKLYHIPDLLLLNTLDKTGAIVAKEAVIMKLPTIGLATNLSFPFKIGFRYFGNTLDFEYIKSFIYILMYAMEVGKDLYMTSNFCGYDGISSNLTQEELIKNAEIFIIKRSELKDPFFHFKQISVYTLFYSYFYNNQFNKYKDYKKKSKITLLLFYKIMKLQKNMKFKVMKKNYQKFFFNKFSSLNMCIDEFEEVNYIF